MPDTFVTAILPYAVTVGIKVSAIASIALVVGTFTKTQRLNSDIMPRLAEIDSAIERSAHRIDGQVTYPADALAPAQARSVVSDLYEIASDLQGRANEVYRLLDRIESDVRLTGEAEDRGRIVDLGKAVLQTESYLSAVLQRIELRKNELAAAPSARGLDEG